MLTRPAVADRVRELTSTVGTGAVTLSGAVSGFASFATAFPGTSTQVYYCIATTLAGSWEVGIGTFTLATNILSRDTIISSSNGGSVVSFPSGTKDVFVTMPASITGTFSTFNVGSTAPLNPSTGDTWLCLGDGIEYTWYTDTNGSQWVDLNSGALFGMVNSGVKVYVSNTQPADTGVYMWIQTGLGDDGTDSTMWINQ